MALNSDTAKKLFDAGVLTEETYNKLVPSVPASPINVPAPTSPLSPSIAPAPPKDDGYGDVSGLINAIAKAPAEKGYEDISLAAKEVSSGKKASGGASGSWDEPTTPGVAPAGGLASDTPTTEELRAKALREQADRVRGRQGNLESGYNIQQEAIMKGAAAGVAQAAAESAHLQKTYDETERMRTEEMAREVERRERLKGDEDLLRSAIDKYQATPATTQEKFASMDTGSKIMTGIAMFLGAAPNSSGGNRAVDVMQRAVDADLAKAKQGVNDRNSLYKEMKDTFGDERQAEAATRLAYIQNAQLKLQQVAAQYKGPQIKANAEALYGQLEVAKQAQMLQFEQAAQLNPSMQMADQMTKDIYRLPKDLQGKAMEERGIIESLGKAEKVLGDSYDTVAKVGFELNPLSADKADREAAKSTIMSTVAANWKGPMSDSDLKRMEGLMPSEWDTKAQVAKKKQAMIALVKANAKPTPILEGFGMKPKTDAEKYPDKKSND